MKIRIRSAEIGDIPRLTALFIEFLFELKIVSEDPYFDFDNIESHSISELLAGFLSKDNGKIYCTVGSDDELTGFIMGMTKDCFLPLSTIQTIGYIEALYVSQSFRREGAAKALEEHLLRYFKELNLEYIELNLLSANDQAREFWNACGYRTFREQCRKKL